MINCPEPESWGAPGGDWEYFKRFMPEQPVTDWEGVWEIVYRQLVVEADPPGRFASEATLRSVRLAATGHPEFEVERRRQRDALRSAADKADQHAEDLEAEVGQFKRARDLITRPKGLIGGLGAPQLSGSGQLIM